MTKDYYKILGVSRDASTEEIKKAFHTLAHKHHPYKGGDEKKFKEINEAYQVLSNREKRAQYDQFGHVFEGAAGAQGAGKTGPGFDFGFDFGKDFEFGFGSSNIEEIFEEFFGFGRKRKTKNQGRDIEIELEINLEDTLNEIEKRIPLGKYVICSRCQGKGAEPGTKLKECFTCRGTGEVQQIKETILGSFTRYTTCPQCQGEGKIPEKSCNVCQGEGRIKKEEEIEILIPAGVDTNQIIKVKEQGEAGRRGAKAGDLYVKIFVRPHKVFKRKGDDIYINIPISFAIACLGDEIDIPLLDGKKISLKVPAGTESGKVLRISGKGIPHFSGYGRGDMYVNLIIKTPKNLTKQQKELLEKLKEEGV
ncbi:molecular chaperone DnaJ [bacterium (Candidatus Gribaldobacteria) CG07_land_8_20_14_0_80_33_18]|uniref:Chaperone protein DnaJ n=1 Tax=bacterium (Candidatus Gribaldobacteria) CG07_land_8_20_14_0_80_33_18 TaxID=2014272 RepID=A0A2M6Z2Z0_9BACT|nr:MAG: molecular chaperone DnaJ [bacterium (Candidatus Gribaldobacteria) CG07_land_8_20_14_0_80_33_18]